MQDGSIIDIILFAAVAAFIFYRLRSTLGSRTGHEKPPHDPYSARNSADDNVIQMPNRDGAEAQADQPIDMVDPLADLKKLTKGDEGLMQGLQSVMEKDQSFNPRGFLQGARSAYEMIVLAFARGDKDALKPLLAEDVFEPFAGVIDGRADRSETVDTQIIGVKKADLVSATLNNQIAEVTVKFVTDLISTTRNSDDNVIEGDPNTVSEVTDIWTFARDTQSTNPNWILIATESA